MLYMPPEFTSAMTAGGEPDWLKGVRRYQQSTYRRPPCAHNVVWTRDDVRCFQIGGDQPPDTRDASPVVLFIPSLINRHYILDLTEELSLLRYAERSGIHTYCVDWGEPPAGDMSDAETYILRYLQPLVNCLYDRHGRPVIVAGYCIGGLLALGLSLVAPERIAANVLLATPWDFDAHPHSEEKIHRLHQAMAYACCQAQPTLSGAYISWLFYLSDPEMFREKYRKFALLSPDSEAYARFIAVEHWVNDTVPLTRPFARNCLIDWAGDNRTAKFQWRVGDLTIDPRTIACPVLLAAPKRDRIVPPNSATALFPLLKNATLLNPDTGHIGMIIGRNRLKVLWQPLVEWIHARARF